MCKNRIETALDIEGIKFASWSIKNKICIIRFIPEIISEDEIHKLIAKFCRVKFNYEIISENDIHKLISEV